MDHKLDERGFTYIDVLIGVMILMVGVLALTAAITTAVIRSREGEQLLIAKQLATSTLESVHSARDLRALGWDAIGNLPPIGTGIFLTGDQPIRQRAGVDRVVGTDDDDDDATNPIIPNFTRSITVTDICDPDRPSANCDPVGTNPVMMRRVDIVIRYGVSGVWREQRLSTILTNFLR